MEKAEQMVMIDWLSVRRKTIEGLADAEEHVIWDESEVQGYGRWIWAPELHKLVIAGIFSAQHH